jgi:hypothetical protein
MQVVGALALFLFSLRATSGDKDDSYYVAGTGNPNVYETMYWKDTENVLQDLSSFSSLYVQYHRCAWTWMQKPEADNDIEENDYWYLGKIPPMGANVAFSLYGQLKGKTFTGCSSGTFINSFYTKGGFTDFAKAMKNAGVSGFSSYSYSDDSYSSSTLTASCQGGSGIGCDSSGGFAVHTYSSNLCDPQTTTAITDTLYYLNKAMSSAKCIKIYTAGSYSSYSSSSRPLALLNYSSACFYQNMWSPDGECPDPYGKIAYYKKNFYKEMVKSKSVTPVAIYKQKSLYEEKTHKGQILAAIGGGLFALGGLLLLVDRMCCTKTRVVEGKSPRMSRRARRERDRDASTVKSEETNVKELTNRVMIDGKTFLWDDVTQRWTFASDGEDYSEYAPTDYAPTDSSEYANVA